MKRTFFLLTCLFAWATVSAQVPSVSYIDVPGNESAPQLIAKPTGGYYLFTSLSKSNPDSSIGTITSLDANLTPLWSRQIKTKANSPLNGAEADANGVSVMLNTYGSQSNTSPVICRFDANGNVAGTIEILDSANANLATSPFFNKITLANERQILFNAIDMVHVNPQGKVDFARQYKFGKPANNNMGFRSAAVFPGTNQWIVGGNIYNTELCFLMKFQDTTLQFVHVYNTKPQGLTDRMTNLEVLPGGEILAGWSDNAHIMHHFKLSASDGAILWRKTHKYTTVTNPGAMTLTSNGDIWMHGSISAGQAGGLLLHFSPTAQFLGAKGQFKLGMSHGNLSALAELPNNELLTMQRGYYENRNVFFVNRIHQTMDFYCFDAIVGNFIDTTYTVPDSLTTLVVPFKKRFGTKTTLTTPLSIRNLTVTTGPVVCTPTVENAALFTEKPHTIYPNPAKNTLRISGAEENAHIRITGMDGRTLNARVQAGEVSVSDLPPGLYVLEVPLAGIRSRFVKE